MSGHGNVCVEQPRHGTFCLRRQGGIDEMILRRVRYLCPNVELNTGERPTGREFFEGGSRSGIDALGMESGKPQFIRERHGKTATERGGDEFVRVGPDSFSETCPKR